MNLVVTLSLALFLGVPFGMGLGMFACSVTLASVERRHKRHIIDLQKRIGESSGNLLTPIEIGALGKLTDLAVLDGYCAICGSDRPELLADPFSPAHHGQNPFCPVPLARQLFLRRIKRCRQPASHTHQPDCSEDGGLRLLPSLRPQQR